jgi:hypothetical protein
MYTFSRLTLWDKGMGCPFAKNSFLAHFDLRMKRAIIFVPTPRINGSNPPITHYFFAQKRALL